VTKPSIEVVGAKKLAAALRKTEGGIADLKVAHSDAARIVEGEAKTLVPRRSGTLAASIRSSGTQAGGVVRAGRAKVPYANVIHFGWPRHNITPQPFLYDAVDARRNEVVESFNKHVKKITKRHLD
jgi:hypothetical protein